MEVEHVSWTHELSAGPTRDQVEHYVPLAEINEVRLSYRTGSTSTSGVWSFELELAASHASDHLYDISADSDRLVLECVASSVSTEMWVVGLRLWLAEESGMQFSPVRQLFSGTGWLQDQPHACCRLAVLNLYAWFCRWQGVRASEKGAYLWQRCRLRAQSIAQRSKRPRTVAAVLADCLYEAKSYPKTARSDGA